MRIETLNGDSATGTVTATYTLNGAKVTTTPGGGTYTINAGGLVCPECGLPTIYVGDPPAPAMCRCPIQLSGLNAPALGWECPRCHRCYAPTVQRCEGCGGDGTTGGG